MLQFIFIYICDICDSCDCHKVAVCYIGKKGTDSLENGDLVGFLLNKCNVTIFLPAI